jgi:hypothetical protein
MENNNITPIEGENMILCEDENFTSTEFNVPNLESLTEEVSQPMDIEAEDAVADTVLVPLKILMDIDTTVGARQVPSAQAGSPTVVVEPSAEKVRTRKPRGPYRRYTAHQIEQLFDYVIEQGKTAEDAALFAGINIRTAQHDIKKYNMTKNDVCR